MKKGFTLVELLVVVVVLVTLMAITFRLSSIGADQSARNTAVARLQKLENCLSGYYAAFGSYPPVALHGSRNYALRVSEYGIQSDSEEEPVWNWFDTNGHKVKDSKNELIMWKRVEAACRAQPLRCSFPFPDDWGDYIEEMSKLMSQNFSHVSAGALGAYNTKSEWRRAQIFQFGLMSFLLPRYMVMMRGERSLYNDQEQWLANNTLPCDPIDGDRFDGRTLDDPNQSWDVLRNYANSDKPMYLAHVQNIPSQAACARWMPNLEGVCAFSRDDRKFFGIDIRDDESRDEPGIQRYRKPEMHALGDEGNSGSEAGSASGGGTGSSYVLDSVTVYDGFTKSDEDGDGFSERGEFFYYSPPPYQSYVLWSAGPNMRTFPPWVPRESLDADARACVGYWTEDDIVVMSH